MSENGPVTIKQIRSRLALPTRNPQRIRGIIRDVLDVVERLENDFAAHINNVASAKKEPEQCLKTKPELPAGIKNSWKPAKPLPSGQPVSPGESGPSLSETKPSSPPDTMAPQGESPTAENPAASTK